VGAAEYAIAVIEPHTAIAMASLALACEFMNSSPKTTLG
jgi:hypothetical protein